jgi:hypothetical protein
VHRSWERAKRRIPRPNKLTFLCPGRDHAEQEPCLGPLPCARHAIPDAQVGHLLFGATYCHTEVTGYGR